MLTPIPVPFNDDSIKVTGLRWSDSDTTQVELVSKRTGRVCHIDFKNVYGLRLLDELDIAETWMNTANGDLNSSWLFQVSSNGWFHLESTRSDFYAQHLENKPLEFLVAGYQECISVLSHSVPIVIEQYNNVGV